MSNVVASVRYVGLPEGLLRSALTAGPEWRAFGERILTVAIEECPVSKSESTPSGRTVMAAHLKDHMEVRFIPGEDPRLLIGSTLTRGPQRYSALDLVISDTEPHVIEPHHPADALHFSVGGKEIFTQRVHHPGTKANPFVQKAMRAVCQEAAV